MTGAAPGHPIDVQRCIVEPVVRLTGACLQGQVYGLLGAFRAQGGLGQAYYCAPGQHEGETEASWGALRQQAGGNTGTRREGLQAVGDK